MDLFNVYPRFSIEPNTANGCYIYDKVGTEYLDLYGGHGVISIGHTQPNYVKAISSQLDAIGFYSNSVQMPIQEELASLIGKASGYEAFSLFLCNSGAEANENALKLASFQNGKSKVIALKNSFHGRTAAALTATDNKNLQAEINTSTYDIEFVEINNISALTEAFKTGDICAFIFETIQGVGGLDQCSQEYLQAAAQLCKANNAILIADEVQCGYGRSGKFFAHQHSGIIPDLITIAKGMGNGFPVGGVLIHPKFEAKSGMLGTTFGGNYLACAASISTLQVIEEQQLTKNAALIGDYLVNELSNLEGVSLKGKGLMFGVEFEGPVGAIRQQLLDEFKIFTGGSSNPNLLRILPPLTITKEEIQPFIQAIKTVIQCKNS